MKWRSLSSSRASLVILDDESWILNKPASNQIAQSNSSGRSYKRSYTELNQRYFWRKFHLKLPSYSIAFISNRLTIVHHHGQLHPAWPMVRRYQKCQRNWDAFGSKCDAHPHHWKVTSAAGKRNMGAFRLVCGCSIVGSWTPSEKSQMRLNGLSFGIFVYYCGFMQDFRK